MIRTVSVYVFGAVVTSSPLPLASIVASGVWNNGRGGTNESEQHLTRI